MTHLLQTELGETGQASKFCLLSDLYIMIQSLKETSKLWLHKILTSNLLVRNKHALEIILPQSKMGVKKEFHWRYGILFNFHWTLDYALEDSESSRIIETINKYQMFSCNQRQRSV